MEAMNRLIWKVYYRLPKGMQKGVYLKYIANKKIPFPVIEKSKTKPKFCLSFDFESALGAVHARHSWRRNLMCKDVDMVNPILNILNKNKIRATWLSCGHLFLEECQRENGIAHADIDRIKVEWYKEDWFREDPCTDFNENKYWYAPDLIEKLVENKQEIGSHSFSHIDFSHKTCTEKIAMQEMEKCVIAAKKFGIKLKSFVFPYGKQGHLNVLRENDIKFIRVDNPARIGDIKVMEGIITVPSAYHIGLDNLNKKNDWKKIINNGIENGGITHFWTHPWELANEKLLQEFKLILETINKKIKEGKIENITMQETEGLAGD